MAGTIQFFPFIRELYQLVGIRPQRNPNSPFASYNWRNSTLLLLFLTMFTASTAYFLYEAHSFAEYSASFYMAISLLVHIVCMPTIIPKMADIFVLMDKFGEFAKQRNDPSSTLKYFKMDDKIDRVLKKFVPRVLKLHTISYVLLYFLRTIIDFYFFDLGDESFHLFYLALWPFNWRTRIGYLISFAIEFTTIACAQIWFSVTVAFFIGLYRFLIAFAKDIASDLNFLSIGGTSNQRQRQAKLIKRFCRIVQLYADARHIVDEFNRIFGMLPTAFILWFLSSLSIPLLQLQIELKAEQVNLIGLLRPITSIASALIFIFSLCESGQMVTNQYEILDFGLYQCDWYTLPIRMQRSFVVFMSFTQQPVMIRGFANVRCVRETCKKATHASLSYFMMLRRING